MRKSDAVAFYGTQKKLAAELGRVQATVAHWGDVVPLQYAYRLEKMTGKKLRIDPSLYPDLSPASGEKRP